MTAMATINARLEAPLKAHGQQVLQAQGISTTEAIVRLFEYLEQQQTVPDWMKSEEASPYEKRRQLARALVADRAYAVADNAEASYYEHLALKHGEA